MDTEKGSGGDETERETYRMLCIVYPASERLDRNMSISHRKHTQHSAESAQQLSPRADTESQKRAREEEGGVNISFNSHRLQHDYFLSFMKSYQHILRSSQSSSSSSSWVLHSVSSNKNPPLGWLALYFLSLSPSRLGCTGSSNKSCRVGIGQECKVSYLRIMVIVSFRSFPWNGSVPVSISNCERTGHHHAQRFIN